MNHAFEFHLNQLLDEYDDCHRRLERAINGLPRQNALTEPTYYEATHQLAHALACALAEQVDAQDTQAAETLRHHPIHSQVLLQSAFIRHAYLRPYGYPGDKDLMLMICQKPDAGDSNYAVLQNRVYLNLPAAAAVRQRVQGMAQHLAQLPVYSKVLNLACGPALEVKQLFVQHPDHPLCIDLVDHDPRTILYTQTTIDNPGVRHLIGNALHLAHNFRDVQVAKNVDPAAPTTPPQTEETWLADESYDLVYTMGLYDYLPYHPEQPNTDTIGLTKTLAGWRTDCRLSVDLRAGSGCPVERLAGGQVPHCRSGYCRGGQSTATPGWHVEDDLPFAINSIKLNTQGKYMSDLNLRKSDLNLRKAVAYALNYAELPKRTNPPVTIAAGPTPRNFPSAPADLETPTYDLAKAKSYLQQSLWPEGGITLDYAYAPALINEEITGQLLRDGLQQLNITLNLQPLEWDAMTASCASPETGYDMINLYTIPAYFDPDAHLYNQYHSSQWGSYTVCSFYKNEAVDNLLDEARATAAPDKRQALYAEANRFIAADQPAIWTFTDVQFVAANDCIQNFRSSKPDNVIVLFQDLTMVGCK